MDNHAVSKNKIRSYNASIDYFVPQQFTTISRQRLGVELWDLLSHFANLDARASNTLLTVSDVCMLRVHVKMQTRARSDKVPAEASLRAITSATSAL